MFSRWPWWLQGIAMPMLGCCKSLIVLLCRFKMFWMNNRALLCCSEWLPQVLWHAGLLHVNRCGVYCVSFECVCVCVGMGKACSSDPSQHPGLLLTLSNVSFRDTTAKSQNSHQTSHSFREDRFCTHLNSPRAARLHWDYLYTGDCFP